MHRKLLRRKTPGFLEALHVGELYRFWNTAWHHYAPTGPHAEASSIRTRSVLRNKMVSACGHARVCISTWNAFYASVEQRDNQKEGRRNAV